MSKQAESKLAEKCLEYLKHLETFQYPVWWDHRSGSGGFSYKKGIPDLYIVINGVHIECELKTPVGKRSAMQVKWAHIFELKNIPYICPHTFEEFQEFIDKFL